MCSALSHRWQRTGLGNAACLKDTLMGKKKRKPRNIRVWSCDSLSLRQSIEISVKLQQSTSPYTDRDADQTVGEDNVLKFVWYRSSTEPFQCLLSACSPASPFWPGGLPRSTCLKLGERCTCLMKSLRLSTCTYTFPAEMTIFKASKISHVTLMQKQHFCSAWLDGCIAGKHL